MSVPELPEFRAVVDRIKSFRDSVLIKTLYLLAARVNEITLKISSSRGRETRSLGKFIDWSIREFDGEKALVVKCPVLKRKPKRKREGDVVYKLIALPVNPIYEPWTLDLLKWIKQTGKISFDLSRFGASKILKKHLEQYWPGIHLHSLRHFRCTHLSEIYGFSPMDLVTYMGWTYRTAFGISMLDRYMHLSWKDYFPKLLRPLKG